MRLTRQKAVTIKQALKEWEKDNILTSEERQRLEEHLEIIPFDWKRLARYSFWIALACIIISVASILVDEELIEWLLKIFDLSAALRALVSGAIAGFFYYKTYQRRKRFPEKTFSNEAWAFLGVLFTALSISQIGFWLDTGSGHFSLLLLLAAVTYAFLGYRLASPLIWLFALLSLGSWFGAETGYLSGWGAYYFGMNYPLRFVLFGTILTGATYLFRNTASFRPLYSTTLKTGLFYLFMALWILSIFGNYDMNSWQRVKQIELAHWGLLFGLVAAGSIWHGLKCDNNITRSFGLTFLGINLYTRFFEYFWDSVHKAIFFAILGLSFWLIGQRAERIWNWMKSDLDN